ncbi:MAG TPA: multicopper oxidase domain-containing protein [Candidatus Limnocylindrales bacterium]|nr:multicopper oxidase domain-containing protein [Candidatus Limnocylindrales bacterium]
MLRRLGRLIVAGTVILSLAACAAPRASSWSFPPPSAEGPNASGDPGGHDGGASHAPGQGSAGTISIEAFDLGFTPASVTVPAAGMYDVEFKNTGVAPHDVTFADGTTIAANGGETATGTVTIPAEGMTFLCSIPGHAAGGMEGEVTVEGAAPSGSSDDHGGPLPAGDVEADPNAPPYETYDATAPAILPGAVHDIELVITEEEKTVAEGFVQKVWTFGGTVPGPAIRVKVGDTIRVHLKNPAESQLSHSIDFHASQVAWNDEMRSIAPGEELVYEWTADYAGVWMYHCGTAPTLHHIANGMYGMVIVEPREGLPPVDHEFALLQSEWYLGPQGKEADLEKAMAAAPAPDLVMFNGVANQYKDHPLEVATGGSVRMFVLNAGPSIDSSFHIVGTIFDTVIKEGVTLTKGNAGNWGSQAVDLSPAQGAIVEFTTAEDGLYPVVTHAFNFVGRGALGLVQAGDGDPQN